MDQDYVEVDPNDYARRVDITRKAIDQYSQVLASAKSEKLRKKAKSRIEEAKVIIEAIEAEKEAAAAEAEAAATEAAEAEATAQ